MSSENTTNQQTSARPRPLLASVGPVGWLHQNLFNSWFNSILTFFCLWILWLIVSNFFPWAIWNAAFGTTRESCEAAEGACWSFISGNWYLFLVGTYTWEERWRPFVCYGLIIVLALLNLYPAYRQSRWLKIAWFTSPLVILAILTGGTIGLPPVDTTLWGGLMLTLILATVGIIVSFPIGLLLALGRRSQKMPIVKAICIAYIEIVRSVPLITVLFMSSVMLPLFFPDGFTMDKVLRAQIGIIMFSAAYLAEVVRGGLQALSKGQEEAAHALGLNYFQTMTFIILPQALRIMIPNLVGSAIGLFKDTSLVGVIGLFDFLSIQSMATANPKWHGMEIEGYVFIALVYWVFCYLMSRYAGRLEQRLDTGQ